MPGDVSAHNDSPVAESRTRDTTVSPASSEVMSAMESSSRSRSTERDSTSTATTMPDPAMDSSTLYATTFNPLHKASAGPEIVGASGAGGRDTAPASRVGGTAGDGGAAARDGGTASDGRAPTKVAEVPAGTATGDAGTSTADARTPPRDTAHAHTVGRGETIESIATARLGESATDKQREQFMKAVRTLNELGDKEQPKEGERLSIPTREGDRLVHRSPGMTMSFLDNGLVRTEAGAMTTTHNPRTGEDTIKVGGLTIKTNRNTGVTETTEGSTTTTVRPDRSVTVENRNYPKTTTTTHGDGSREVTVSDQVNDKELKTQYNSDGKLLLESHKDLVSGTTFSRSHDGSGGTTDIHSGGRAESNMSVTTGRDGSISVKDAGSDKAQTFLSDSTLTDPRKALMERAERHITDPGLLSRFKGDMVRFENSAAERGLPSSEIRDTYTAMSRLFDGGTSTLPQGKRDVLAMQVMSQAARPSTIDQSTYNTCAVASLENVVYTTHPSRAANLVADVATTGEYRTAAGAMIHVPPGTFTPAEGGRQPVADNTRSFASQIFQVTAANSVLQTDGTSRGYEQGTSFSGATSGESIHRLTPTTDEHGRVHYTRGEALTDRGGENSPDFLAPEIKKAYEAITGERRTDLVLGHKEGLPEGAGATTFSSPSELREQLEQLKAGGRLPVILQVHTNHEPFKSDSRHPARDGGAWHAVTISGIDSNGMVMLDNQWGSRSDRRISLEQLYKATRK